jgi:hypothetical protein
MITNLPKIFPLNNLERFSIGDVEPENDAWLHHKLGVCKINPAIEFLRGKKSLIIGQRGTGKTTLFKLICDGKLFFQKKKHFRDIILAIDENLDYAEMKSRISAAFHTAIKDDTVKCRYFWEMYLLFRMLVKLKEEFTDLPADLENNLTKIETILGYKEKQITIKGLLAQTKYTSGLKFSQTPLGTAVTPEISVEPSDSISKTQKAECTFNIETCKKEINSFLTKKRGRFFVLMDKLDEFVASEAYLFQKILIQGLLECERSYIKHENIKLKLFLRTDLFEKLNFESLGYEKIQYRKIDLIWNIQDIRRLIAQRILLNYFEHLNLDQLEFDIDKEKLYLDAKSIRLIEGDDNALEWTFFKKTKIIFKKLIRRIFHDARTGRHISFNDAINREIITSMFPRTLKHRHNSGKHKSIDIMDFFESHLCLSNNILTPRIFIMFVQKCLDCASSYYRENPDLIVKLDEHNEYPLIKRDCCSSAYEVFKKELWDSFYNNMPYIWKPFLNNLRVGNGGRNQFGFKDLEKILKLDDQEQLRQLVAFLCHINLLECKNPLDMLSERTYMLPIVLSP